MHLFKGSQRIITSLIISVVTCSAAPTKCPTGTSQNSSAFVDLGYSQYQGTVLPSGINQYLGMRYAAAPTGNLRWRAPIDPNVTVGTQNASSWGNTCMGLGGSSNEEDCLLIHVFAPQTATPASKLPVWFFIQGGGYNTNSNANINGTKVLQQSNNSIVMVNFNYRVSLWGFLASEKVRADGDLNAGLLDQRKALKWVQKYIHLFGGDPDHVVIHGVSAGAGSVATHLTAYGGRNDKLFIGAVGESPFLPWQPKVSEFEWQFDRFAQSAGCGNATDQMSCLRGLDVAYLQNRNKASAFPNGTAAPKFYWTPTVDGDLIRDYPARMIASGRFIKVPVLFGDDTDEGTSFAANASTPAEVAQFMTNYYPKLTSANTDSINAQYPLMAPLAGYAPYFPSASAAYGESTFTCPGISVAQAYNQHADPSAVWLYRYNGQGPDGSAQILVTHTVELPAIFGTRMTGSKVTSFESYNAPMVDTMMNYWISFVKTLNPNTLKWTEAPVWETFGVSQQRIMLQTNKTAMETVSVEQAGRCLFWKNLAVAMEV